MNGTLRIFFTSINSCFYIYFQMFSRLNKIVCVYRSAAVKYLIFRVGGCLLPVIWSLAGRRRVESDLIPDDS